MSEKLNKYARSFDQQALLLENIFSKVSCIQNPDRIAQLKKELESTLLLPNQMMYLVCYNPSGIFFARNIEKFLPYNDNELTVDKIIKHIAPIDITFVTNSIRAIYDWYRSNGKSEFDTVFTIEHRLIDKHNKILFVQRNSKVLEIDESNLPVLAVSIITNVSSIVNAEFTPRASLFNPHTNEQYFYKEAVNQNHIWISKRELEVLELLCMGLSSKQIAIRLFISKHTVDGHRRVLLEKMEVSSTPELISLALKNKWVKQN